MLELDVVTEVPAGVSMEPVQAVMAALEARRDGLGLPAGRINLALVDDEEIRTMNREFSGNDYATDVLSFNYLEDGGEAMDGVIGEMAISLETAERQAAQAEMTLDEEVALLALHGVLHISGFDHQTPEEQVVVQGLQQEIMTEAGYGYREFTWTS